MGHLWLLLVLCCICSASGNLLQNSPTVLYQTTNPDDTRRITDHLVLGNAFLIAEQTGDDQFRTEIITIPLVDDDYDSNGNNGNTTTTAPSNGSNQKVADMTVRRVVPSSSSQSFLAQAFVNGWERIVSFDLASLNVTSLNQDIVLSDDIPEFIDCVEAIPNSSDDENVETAVYGIFGRHTQRDSRVGVVSSNNASNWERRDLKFYGCPVVLPDNSILVQNQNKTDDGSINETMVKLSVQDGTTLAVSPWLGKPLFVTQEDSLPFMNANYNETTRRLDLSLLTLDIATLEVINSRPIVIEDRAIRWLGGEYGNIVSPDGHLLYMFDLGDRRSYVGMYNISGDQPELVWRTETNLPLRSGLDKGLQQNYYLTKDGARLLVTETTGLVVRDALSGKQLAVLSFVDIKQAIQQPPDTDWYGLEVSVTPDETAVLLSYGLEIFQTSQILAVPFPSEEIASTASDGATTSSSTGSATSGAIAHTCANHWTLTSIVGLWGASLLLQNLIL